MYFYIAFDKKNNIEYLLYKDMIHKDNIYYSEPLFKCKIAPIGQFVLDFLNTDFEGTGIGLFIKKFCYASLYFQKYPEKRKTDLNFISLELSERDYFLNLFKLMESEKDDFIYIKNIFLKYLNLPYNSDIVDTDDEDYNLEPLSSEILELVSQMDEYIKERDKKTLALREKFKKFKPELYAKYEKMYNEKIENRVRSESNDNGDISVLINNLSLEFTFGAYYLSGIYLSNFDAPYCLRSSDVKSILAIEFKEFLSGKYHTIRQCKNCGRYFIPKNLRDVKYCDNIFKNDKTCKQIGKELAYKKTLQSDKLLDMYRKRYLSLASSVSHYGTDTAIAKFEKYKKDGAVMKKKYLNKEISGEEFEDWILHTYTRFPIIFISYVLTFIRLYVNIVL